MLPASIAPSALPAPTMVCSSSMKRMTCPSCFERSFSTAFSRSSNSPRNFAPAIKEPISSARMRLPRSDSGTSPLTMRNASPSTIAVLPTPGSPISTGLFLVRRCSTWMVRRISSSRPMTGSSLPSVARFVRSTVYFSSACRLSSAFGSWTVSPPRSASTALSRAACLQPASFNNGASDARSSKAASRKFSLEMYWSPRRCASLSVTLSRRCRSFETCTSPARPSTLGRRSSAVTRSARSRATLPPADCSSARMLPPC